jgi:uncharacterized Zn finger protein
MSHKMITEADIEALATAQSFERGYDYYHSGAVYEVVRRGDELTAEVEGSQYDPYTVRVTLDESGIAATECTCPYDWGGICKHIVAVLLYYIHEVEAVTEKRPLELLLADLSANELRQLIQRTAESRPDLVNVIEQELEWLAPDTAESGRPAPTVDLNSIRREMSKDFRLAGQSTDYGYHDYYDDGPYFDADEIIRPHLDKVAQLLDAGDLLQAEQVAVAIMEAFNDGLMELDEWLYEYNEETINGALVEIELAIAAVILSSDPSAAEREVWLEQIAEWENDLGELAVLTTVIEQGWDYPPLVAAMQGKLTKHGAWDADEEVPYFANELTQVRLAILRRQERYDEYLNLALAEGQHTLYVDMLFYMGQVEKAVEEAKKLFVYPQQVLALAQQLVSVSEMAVALDLAAFGLTLTEKLSMAELAEWTSDRALAATNLPLALQAAETAFRSRPNLANFQRAEAAAGAAWPTVRQQLLDFLATTTPWDIAGKVDVYLHEGLLKEAMAAVDQSNFYYLDNTVERVIEATREQYPDWGIACYKKQAARIMNEGKAKYYETAASHLKKARDIYVQHGRLAEWQAYLDEILHKHGRKYKLVPLLRNIR